MFSYYRFLHFVFADETDTYFIESGTGIKFRFYLWYQLCKDEFKEIYFLNGTKQNLKIEFLDRASFQAYQSKSILGVFGKAKSYDRNDRVQPVENLAKYYAWMTKQLKKGRQAFVIPLDVFESLVSGADGEQFLEELIDLAGQKTESTIVLSAFPESEETRKLLAGAAFRHKSPSGRRLCGELYDILHKKELVSLYEALYEEMDGAAVFLNVYDRNQLRRLVYAAQYRQAKEVCSEIELEAVTDYLYCWCRSRNMRRGGAALEVPKKSIRFAGLYEQLQSEITWRKLRKAAASFYESKKSKRIETLYPDLARRMDGFYCGEADCYEALAKAADAVMLEGYRDCGGSREDIQWFEQFKDQVHTPVNWELNGTVEVYVLGYLKRLDSAVLSGFGENRRGDSLDAEDAVHQVSQIIEALNFGRRYLWEKPGEEEQKEILDICELYKDYLEVSQQKRSCSRKRRQLKQRYDRLSELGETDAELALRLENIWTREQVLENGEQEMKKRLLHCREELEEDHFDALQGILQKWKTEKKQEKKRREEQQMEQQTERAVLPEETEEEFVPNADDLAAVKKLAHWSLY